MTNACNIVVEKTERKRPLWRHRRSWEDKIKMDFKKIACEDVDFIQMAHGSSHWWTPLNTIMKPRV
jgi:hypothetical protein